MTSAENDFRTWFIESLKPLRNNGDAGFIFLFTALPLLERYLRRKTQCADGEPLPDRFFSKLGSLFPEIVGREREFWNCYRHGLLHQATFSALKRNPTLRTWSTLPAAAISGHGPSSVYYLSDTNEFYLNPILFFDAVTAEILGDFNTYESVGSGYYYLASVVGDSTAVAARTARISVCCRWALDSRPWRNGICSESVRQSQFGVERLETGVTE